MGNLQWAIGNWQYAIYKYSLYFHGSIEINDPNYELRTKNYKLQNWYFIRKCL